MKVRVDLDRCVGHGRCYELASELFGEDERGHCHLETEEVPPGREDLARLAVANCPEKALSVLEEAS